MDSGIFVVSGEGHKAQRVLEMQRLWYVDRLHIGLAVQR